MSEAQAPVCSESCEGPINERAIRKFLALVDDGEVARLAAVMAPKSEEFDAKALIARAVELQAEAEAELVRRRETLASEMNYDTLVEVAKLLDSSDLINLDDVGQREFSNPVVGPVVRKIWEIQWNSIPRECKEFSHYFAVDDFEEKLVLADERTSLSRPSIICKLENALRYSANEPMESIPYEMLKLGFMDCLRKYPLWKDDELPFVTHYSAEMATNTSIKPVAQSASPEKNEPLNFIDRFFGSWKTPIQETINYREDFIPFHPAPDMAETHAKEAFAECWNKEYPFINRSMLAWLTVHFYSFWQDFGEYYHTALELFESRSRNLSETNRKSAVKSLECREQKVWTALTQEFVTKMNGKPIPQDLEKRLHLIEEFAARHSGKRSKNGQRNVRIFFRMLCAYPDKNVKFILNHLKRALLVEFLELRPERQAARKAKMNPSELLGLEKGEVPECFEVFRAVTEDTIRDCLALLAPAMQKVGVKKSQKKP